RLLAVRLPPHAADAARRRLRRQAPKKGRPPHPRSPGGGGLPLRVGTPLPPPAADAARRRLRRQARKKGRTPDRRSLEAAGFLMLVSNLDPTAWSPAQVLALYRIRGQVERV